MEDVEELTGKAEQIFVTYTDEDGVLRKYNFSGKWLTKMEGFRGRSFDVALTEQEKIFVLIEDEIAGKGTHIVFDSFHDFSEDKRVDPDVIHSVAAAIGEGLRC